MNSLGFREASIGQLRMLDYLLQTRELARDELDRIDRWVDGMNNFSPNTMINWLKDMPYLAATPFGKLP